MSTDVTTRNEHSKAYSEATTKLREAHRDEFNGYVQEAMAKRGITWTPRLTDEQKAMLTIRELLEQYPALREELDD